jgi:hypothetical protein
VFYTTPKEGTQYTMHLLYNKNIIIHHIFLYSSGINCNLILFTACPENPDLLVILLGVMGGIVAIGIILLILWKLLTAMVVSINSHIILTEWTEFT